LQWADEATCQLLTELVSEVLDLPVWLILAYRPRELASEAMVSLQQESERQGSRVRRLSLERLDAESVARIAVSLVGKEGSAALARYLFSSTQGDPLLLTERINLLWDEGLLLANGNSWRVAVPARELGAPAPVSYEEVLSRRLAKLPASSRRLLTLAAVIGQSFEAWLLESAEQEDGQVVESCMELLLQRWMVRQFLRYWADSRRERDLAMWLQGARRGTFEFAHSPIRRAIVRTLSRDRAQVLHRRVARALETHHASNPEAVCEWLGYHYMNARVWSPACDYFETAAKKARRLSPSTARHYYTEALKALEKLDREKGEDGKTEREERRRRLREARAGL
jgi:eukaryotic-like serine/threonine-protein kinase